MRYIKTYEDINEPMVGDWVICNELTATDDQYLFLQIFIRTHIGKLIILDEIETQYIIKYEYIPEEISDCFFDFESDLTTRKPGNCRRMYRHELIHWSKDKEELEHLISAEKYNL